MARNPNCTVCKRPLTTSEVKRKRETHSGLCTHLLSRMSFYKKWGIHLTPSGVRTAEAAGINVDHLKP